MLAEIRDATRKLFGGNRTEKNGIAKAVDPAIARVVDPEPIHDLAELVADMRKDPMVVITQDVLLSSVKRGDVTINVDAPEGDETASAIEADVSRLWLETLEKFCDPEHGVFTWGGLPFELVVENDSVSGVPLTVIKQFKQLPKHARGVRATELVLDKAGQFGGIKVTIDGSDFVIPPEQSAWFAISATPLEPHGRSLFLGAPAEVRKRRKETDQLIQVFIARWAVDGPTIHAPSTAVDENGRVVNNHALIAAQYHANKTAGGLTILPNDAHSTPGMEGKYQIDITHEARSMDAKPMEAIDNMIDAKMSRAFGVHESVTMDTETGSYASQTVRMFVVLSKCDSLGSQLTSQFESIVNRVYGPANYPGKPPKITVTPTSRITDGLMVETVKTILAMPQWGPLLESGAIDVATILANAGVPLARDYVERLDAAFEQVQADKQDMREQTQPAAEEYYTEEDDPLFQANERYELAVKKKVERARPSGQPNASVKPARQRATTPDDKPIGGRGTNQYAVKGVSKGKEKPVEKPKPSRIPEQTATPRTKSEIAKASMTRVDAPIQQYCEEHNEPILAKMLGGSSLKNNQPVDIVMFAGDVKPPSGPLEESAYADLIAKHGVAHGIEMKTVVSNKAAKLTMKKEAMAKKKAWERKHKAPVHTVVFDDSKVYNANGVGQHDPTKRRIFYRRGYGSFRIEGMHQVFTSEELKTLITMPKRKLPKGAA